MAKYHNHARVDPLRPDHDPRLHPLHVEHAVQAMGYALRKGPSL